MILECAATRLHINPVAHEPAELAPQNRKFSAPTHAIDHPPPPDATALVCSSRRSSVKNCYVPHQPPRLMKATEPATEKRKFQLQVTRLTAQRHRARVLFEEK